MRSWSPTSSVLLLTLGLLWSAQGCSGDSSNGEGNDTTAQDLDTTQGTDSPPDSQDTLDNASSDVQGDTAIDTGDAQDDFVDTSNPSCIQGLPQVVLNAHPGTPVPFSYTLKSCSQQGVPLTITSISVMNGTEVSPYYTVDLTGISLPVVVPAATELEIPLNFLFPEDALLPAGSFQSLMGQLVIESDAPDSPTTVDLSTTLSLCPLAVIETDEGTDVAPHTTLHLSGSDSKAFNGATVAKWEWSVTAPEQSGGLFVPSALFPEPTFQVNTAGLYQFSLKVTDSEGTESCSTSVYEVLSSPSEPIYVELLWTTAGDSDPADATMADLDLHFAHPDASALDGDGNGTPDPWFDPDYDCFASNPEPAWGSPQGEGEAPLFIANGSLAREEVALQVPQNMTYSVGVHYATANGLGTSLATVRVYIFGVSVFEAKDVLLTERDMWDVCRIEYPSGKVTLVTGLDEQNLITSNYPTP